MNIYDAMTVNERLYESGLLKSWDKAARKKDIKAMAKILAQVNLVDQAEAIIASEFARIQKEAG